MTGETMHTVAKTIAMVLVAALVIPLMIFLGLRLIQSIEKESKKLADDYGQSTLFAEISKRNQRTLLKLLGIVAVLFATVPFFVSQQFNLPVRSCYSHAWTSLLVLGVIAYVGTFIRYAIAKLQAGAVLLDLGTRRQPEQSAWIQWFFPVVFGVYALAAMSEGDHVTGALLAGLAIGHSIHSLLTGFTHHQLTERGIFAGYDFVSWQTIENYEFPSEANVVICLVRGWLLSGVRMLPIPQGNLGAVKQIFDDHVTREQDVTPSAPD